MKLKPVTRVATLALAALLASAAPARAESKAEVEVDAQFEPSSSIGLILSPETTIERPILSVKDSPVHTKIVSFAYSDSDIGPSSMATALLVSSTGEIALGNIRPLFAGQNSEDLTLPLCKENISSASLSMEQHGVLQTLIEYRTTRRKLTRLKVVRVMDGETLAKLTQVEDRLGLARGEALGPNLNPVTLIDRLSRISGALRAAKNARDEKLPKVEVPAEEEPQTEAAGAQEAAAADAELPADQDATGAPDASDGQ